MLISYLKPNIRALIKKPKQLIINCIGLSLAFAAALLIFLYVNAEFKHDSEQLNAKRIVRLEYTLGGITSAPIGPFFKENIPEIESFCRYLSYPFQIGTVNALGQQLNLSKSELIFADTSFFNIFTFNLITGDQKTVLSSPNSIVLSTQLAKKMFGNENPIGKIVKIQNNITCQVTGIMDDIKKPSTFKGEAVLRIEQISQLWNFSRLLEKWGVSNFETYFLLKENVSSNKAQEKFQIFIKDWSANNNNIINIENTKINLRPFSDIYFTHLIDWSSHGNRQKTIILAIIGLIIVLIAIINYVNITLSHSQERIRAAGIQRTIGISRGTLITSFIFECIVLIAFSMLIAILVVNFVSPHLTYLAGYTLKLNLSISSVLLLVVIVPILLGVISGFLPAFYISKVTIVDALQKSKNLKNNKLKTVQHFLTVFQFAVSIILIVASIQINNQVEYIGNFDTGYDRQNIILVKGNKELVKNINNFRNALLQNPQIQNAALARNEITKIDEISATSIPGKKEKVLFNVMQIDEYFIDMMNIQLVEGKGYSLNLKSNNNGWIINESLKAAFETDNILEKKIYNSPIIGVVKNFNFKPLAQPVGPLAINILNKSLGADLYIKVNETEISKTINYINKSWKTFFPDYVFEYSFLDERFQKLHRADQLLGKMVTGFSIIAIVIACLGLFALVSNSIDKRTKEIGIRKVIGATVSEILILLTKQFMRLVLVANLIAWPVAWYAMNKWMQNYAYRVDLSIWPFLLAGFSALSIALLTVSFQTIRAATANPVESLQYE